MMVSVATAMIPFLENDDANRALMGSNMQRQAVPLLKTESPIVGTGMEYKAAVDSGVAVIAKNAGTVTAVSADRVIIRRDSDGGLDTYHMIKFKGLQPGHLHQPAPGGVLWPACRKGRSGGGRPLHLQRRNLAGQERPHRLHDLGGLQLRGRGPHQRKDRAGRRVYLHPHRGIRDRGRDTKLGPEEITRDIPNVGEDALKDLDERGIIHIGAEVRSGDILVARSPRRARPS